MYKIAIIIEDGKVAGPQVYIHHISCAMKDTIDTTVICPKENSKAFQDKLNSCNIPFKTFHISCITKEIPVALRYIFYSIFEVLQLTFYLKKNQFDLVFGAGGAWQYKAVIAGKFAGTKILWRLNDSYIPYIFRKIFSFFSRMPDAYLFASECTKKYYTPFIKDRNKPEFIIQSTVNTSYFDPNADIHGDEDLISKWQGKTVIGCIANVNPIKGLDIFIQVAAQLNQKFDKLMFVITGPIFSNQQTFYQKLKNQCSKLNINNIVFTGGRTDTRALLRRFDVYLCTSYAESSPLAVWEAMSMEKAIISTDVGDVKNYLKTGLSGEVTNIGDTADITNKVSMLLNNKEKIINFGKESRKIAINKLDVNYCAQQHLKAYEQIIGK